MQLSEILVDIEVDRVVGPLNLEVRSIVDDSRRVTPGALFAAIPGSSVDGHDHAGEAVRRGAVALLVEHEVAASATQIQVAFVDPSLGVQQRSTWGSLPDPATFQSGMVAIALAPRPGGRQYQPHQHHGGKRTSRTTRHWTLAPPMAAPV